MKKIYLHKVEDQIARHNTIRDINRQIVLNYIRVRSPISRADNAKSGPKTVNINPTRVGESGSAAEIIKYGNEVRSFPTQVRIAVAAGENGQVKLDMPPRSVALFHLELVSATEN